MLAPHGRVCVLGAHVHSPGTTSGAVAGRGSTHGCAHVPEHAQPATHGVGLTDSLRAARFKAHEHIEGEEGRAFPFYPEC